MQGLARISSRCGYYAGGDEADESRSYMWLSQSHVDICPPTHTGYGVAAGRLAAVVDFFPLLIYPQWIWLLALIPL